MLTIHLQFSLLLIFNEFQDDLILKSFTYREVYMGKIEETKNENLQK